MTVEPLLAKLEGVRRAGEGRWTARCPAHEDKFPSLSIRELPDGRILLKCFAGCATQAVLAVVGLNFSHLYPAKPIENTTGKPWQRDYLRGLARPWSAEQLLQLIDRESVIACVAACDVTLEGRVLSERDLARLRKAQERLSAVLGVLR